MPVTFTYFPVCGLGEAIRVALHDLGIAYTENFIVDWPAQKQAGIESGKYYFGQVPHFEDTDNGFNLVQSCAILRHIGRKYNAYGANEQDMCKVDIAIDGVSDWRRLYSKLVYTDKMAPEAVTEYKATAIPLWSQNFERYLGSNAYLVGAQCTIADYALFDLVDSQLKHFSDLLDSTPALKAWYTRMNERSNLKAYIESNPEHRK